MGFSEWRGRQSRARTSWLAPATYKMNNLKLVAGMNFGATLRRSDLRFALPNRNYRVAIRTNLNSKYTVVMRGMDRNIRSIDLRLRFTVFGDRIVCDALA